MVLPGDAVFCPSLDGSEVFSVEGVRKPIDILSGWATAIPPSDFIVDAHDKLPVNLILLEMFAGERKFERENVWSARETLQK